MPALATGPQVAFAAKLFVEFNPSANLADAKATYAHYTKAKISSVIDHFIGLKKHASLDAAKAAQPTTTLPAGMYALSEPELGITLIYKIDKPVQGKWAGWTFVKEIDGKTETPVKGDAKAALLKALEEFGHLEAAALYGKITGTCGICGRTLTDPNSIAAGIGPICAAKF